MTPLYPQTGIPVIPTTRCFLQTRIMRSILTSPVLCCALSPLEPPPRLGSYVWCGAVSSSPCANLIPGPSSHTETPNLL